MAYAALLTAALLALDIGNVLAILLVVFVPGYVLVAALYPDRREIDWIERVALSLGLSIAVVPLLGLLLNFTPFGVRLAPLLGTLMIFTAGVGALAYHRRMQIPVANRPSINLVFELPGKHEDTLVDKALAVGVAASVIVAGLAFAYVLLVPRIGERFTEFYILGPGGNASGYPTRLNVSEPSHVTIGITDREGATVRYTVLVSLLGIQLVLNATGGYEQTIVVNATRLSWFNTTLVDGQEWVQPYPFSIPTPGSYDVQFVLFRDGNLSAAYRVLNLFIRVV